MVIFMIVAIAGYFFFSVAAPIFTSSFNSYTVGLQTAVASDPNLTSYTNFTFGNINRGLQNLEWISYSLLFSLLFGFALIAYNVRSYPFLLPMWIIFTIVLTFCSIYLADAYNDLRYGDGFAAVALQNWEGNDYILQYLPHLVVIYSIVTGIILFILATRDNTVETSL